jgi:hypothetical protein
MNRCDMIDVIHDALGRIAAGRVQDRAWDGVDEQTRLFGEGGILNSLDLVSLILELEDAVRAKIGRRPGLLDEQTLAAGGNPFRDVGSLADLLMRRAGGGS